MIMVTGAARRQQVFRGLRPFNPTRDLNQVIDLLRMAFPEEVGRHEAAWLEDMEALSMLRPFVWVLSQINLVLGGIFYGFVWVEDGRIIGNVTLSRLTSQHWMISNVAVHPDYRRRGIARELMEASVQWLRERGAQWITLQVRRDNTAAKSLYFSLGFTIVEGTTEMERHGVGLVSFALLPEGYRLRPAQPADSPQIFELARRITPELAQRITPLRRRDYEIGTVGYLIEGLRRLIGLPGALRWVVTDTNEQVVAALKVHIGGYPHRIHLLIPLELRGVLEEALVNQALHALEGHRGTIRAQVEADHIPAIIALEAHGFREVRTLDRMALELRS